MQTESPSYDLEWYVNDSKDIYLGGMHVDSLKQKYDLKDVDLLPYMPLRSNEVMNANLKVEFLGGM